jgi:hypothetical protein
MNWLFPGDPFYYFMTYVNKRGQESPMSPVAGPFIRESGQKLSFAGLPVSSDSDITKKRLYRSSNGSTVATSDFRRMDTIDNADTTYNDWKKGSDLATAYYEVKNPKENMHGLVAHPAGFLAAYRGNRLYVADVYLPQSWKYEYPVEHEIMGLKISGAGINVVTKGFPTVFSGMHPGQLRKEEVMWNQSCVSSRGICKHGEMIVYPSPDGLNNMMGGSANLATKQFMQQSQWQAYTPSSMIGAVHEGQVFCFMTGGTIIFDASEGLDAMKTTDETCQGVFVDLETDTMYLIQSDKIMSWNSHATDKKVMKWRTKEVDFRQPVTWVGVRVLAESYPTQSAPVDQRIKLRLYANGTQVAEMIILDNKFHFLPDLRREEVWSYEIESIVKITAPPDVVTSRGEFIR